MMLPSTVSQVIRFYTDKIKQGLTIFILAYFKSRSKIHSSSSVQYLRLATIEDNEIKAISLSLKKAFLPLI